MTTHNHCSCLGNPLDRGAWWATQSIGCKELDKTEHMCTHTHTHTSSAAAAKSLQSCLTVRPHRQQPTRLLCPWDSPGKNTGVGCHFLLQCMKVKSKSEIAQLCPTLSDPMDCSVFQARVLKWVAVAFSQTSSTKSLYTTYALVRHKVSISI